MPTTSLVIATYNWPQALDLVLDSVRKQSILPTEVLVADDGSGEETRRVVERHAADFPVPLRHVWHEDRGFRLAAIRNRATAAAIGDYLLQIDGDILLHPRFVEAHQATWRRGSYVQGSRVLLTESRTREVLATGCTHIPWWSGGLQNRVNALYLPWLVGAVRGPTDPLRRTRGCHMAFWRDDLLAANGYDEAMVGWGREDSELAARLINAGVRRRNLKFSAVAYHLWHREASREAVAQNHAIYMETVRTGRTRCAMGIANGTDPRPEPVATAASRATG